MKVFLAKFSQNWDENEIIEFVQLQEDQKCHLFTILTSENLLPEPFQTWDKNI